MNWSKILTVVISLSIVLSGLGLAFMQHQSQSACPFSILQGGACPQSLSDGGTLAEHHIDGYKQITIAIVLLMIAAVSSGVMLLLAQPFSPKIKNIFYNLAVHTRSVLKAHHAVLSPTVRKIVRWITYHNKLDIPSILHRVHFSFS